MRPKQIRSALGIARIVVAVRGGVCEPSVKLYEADEEAVTPRIRAKLDAVYRDLARQLDEVQ